jgi:hypothetical protein
VPATPQAARLTELYRRRQLEHRARALALTARAWRSVTLDDLAGSFATALPLLVLAASSAQQQAAAESGRYLAGFVGLELGETPRRPATDPASYAGTTADGRPLEAVLGLGIVAVRLALKRGTPAPRALESGLHRVARAAGTEVLEAGRVALADELKAESRIAGWRRVTRGAPCGACLALSAKGLRKTDKALQVHAGCSCTAEPVVAGVQERIVRPAGRELFDKLSPAEQARLFEGTGGEVKAALIRSGEVPLDDLVTEWEHPAQRTTVVETPLEKLAPPERIAELREAART